MITLFDQLSGQSDTIETEDFASFVETQGEKWTKNEIIEKMGKRIDLSSFSNYLR